MSMCKTKRDIQVNETYKSNTGEGQQSRWSIQKYEIVQDTLCRGSQASSTGYCLNVLVLALGLVVAVEDLS